MLFIVQSHVDNWNKKLILIRNLSFQEEIKGVMYGATTKILGNNFNKNKSTYLKINSKYGKTLKRKLL